ncbi:carbohydrate ABC transporter substrate-binding protein [Romboutsia ilealis]|uniref:Carbohydrate ABC transporter substrate-binding protein n=1 Tax=Romboutsia faecis TaxID=2764597 RepID=A0ABR7JRA5_9FIRM|nr:ABC transporter substrate-binding protein [Romboutsia faecis]MBC5997312.1 carbohydrate ABC transporter substrate-binding protein [Romboutsia faecis]MRN23594.1 carbohydrate ABC transporter substrate-binding protein [Romboutsia ilealis]
MRFKKALSLMTVTALICGSLVGCSSSKDSSGGSASGDVTVDIFQFKVETQEALQAAAKKYEESHGGVKINIETIGGGNDYGAGLRTKFQSGQEPTIFNVGGPQDVEDWASKLEDLSDQPWVNQAFEGTLGSVTTDEGIFGMPFAQEGYGFIYNKQIFEKAGIKPEEITTLAKLEEAIKILDSKKSELGIEAVMSLPAKEKWVTGLHLLNVALGNEFASGKEAYEAKKLEFKYSDQLKKILDLQAEYSYMPDGTKASLNSVDYAMQTEQKFATGKVAMIQMGNWTYQAISGVNEEIGNNLGILPMPLEGVNEDSIPVGIPMYWSINKDKSDEEKAAAKDFLNWLYTSDEGKEMVINDFNFIPAFKGYEDESLQPKDPLSAAVLQYSNDGKTMPWVFMGYPSGWGENVVGADIQKYLDGSMSWEELVKHAQDTWEDERK